MIHMAYGLKPGDLVMMASCPLCDWSFMDLVENEDFLLIVAYNHHVEKHCGEP